MGGLEIASLYAKIGADTSGLEKGLGSAKSELSNLDTAMSQLQTGVTVAFAAMGAAAVAMGSIVVKTGFDFLAMKEQAEIAFTTMLGSGEKAQGMLDELQAFAAKTPFEFPDLIRASQRLMAMGFEATEVIPTLTAVGDAVAALGGNAATIDRVTTALGQMNAKGKTSAEEMMQLTEAGIPAWQMLADKIGVTVPEAMAQVSKGAVSAQTTISAVVDGIETKFGGMMEKQSSTWAGMLSTLSDNFTQLSGTLVGPFFEMAKAGLAKLIEGFDILTFWMNEGYSFASALYIAIGKIVPPEFVSSLEKVRDVISNISRFVKALFGEVRSFEDDSPLTSWLVAVGKVIGETIKQVTQIIGKFVKWQDVATALGILLTGAVMSAIGAVVLALWPLISTIAAVTVAVAAARAAWESDFMGIRTYIIRQVDKITEWFKTSSGLWQGTWQDSFLYIADIVSEFVESIPWKLFVMWSHIDYEVRHTTDVVRGIITEWVDFLVDKFEHWKSVAVETVVKTKDKIIENWNLWIAPTIKDLSDWVSITKSHFLNWIDGLVERFGRWKDEMIELFQPVFDWWEDHVQPWIDFGSDIIQGLWDGMKDTWKRFTSWTGTTFQGWVDWFDRLFEFGSPSKVMQQRGEWLMEGLSDGINSAAQLPINEMDALATAVQGKVDGMVTAVTNSAKTMRDTINSMPALPEGYWSTPTTASPATPAATAPTVTTPNAVYTGGAGAGSAVGMGEKKLGWGLNMLATLVDTTDTVQDIIDFANQAKSFLTGNGSTPLQGSSAENLALRSLTSGGIDSLSVNNLIGQIQTLVSALTRKDGARAEQAFNISVLAPDASLTTQQQLEELVSYLNALYG